MKDQRNQKLTSKTKQRQEIMRSNRKITDFISPSRARSESPTLNRLQSPTKDIEVSSNGTLGDFDIKNDLIEISSLVGA